jgi:hypothetical protein
MARLAAYLNEIAAPGTSVHVEASRPPMRLRASAGTCASVRRQRVPAAQERADAYVMGPP